MQKCSKCQIDKSLDQYNKRYKGLQTWCRECSRQRSRDYYATHKTKHIENVKRRNKAYKEKLTTHLCDLLWQSSCVDCGSKQFLALEFDHLHGKISNIADLVQSTTSVEKLQEEIDKCEIVCASCHSIRTHTRAKNTYRWKYMQEKAILI